MAGNLMSFVSDEGPYLHSKIYHFRSDVRNLITKDDGSREISSTVAESIRQLESIQNSLQRAADDFLVDWNGDYRKASQELFLGTSKQNKNGSFEKTYIGTINKLMNSYEFVNSIQRNTKKDEVNTKEISKIFGEYGLSGIQSAIKETQHTNNMEFFVKELMEWIVDKNNTGKRINLKNNAALEQAIANLLGKTQQKYFQNKESLQKQLTKAVQKKSTIVNWDKVYEELRTRFLLEFSGDSEARTFIDSLKSDFINKGKKLKASDYSNITGFIGENLEVVIQSNNTISLTIYDAGERNDTELVEYANDIANKMGFAKNQLSISSSQVGSAKQSGSDWIITNKQGKMVRAQVKNSVQIIEEMRTGGGRIGRPQPIKIQDTISYDSLKRNIQKQSIGAGGLTKDDWNFLDYLVVNYLWFRAGGSVKQGKGGDYSSGISGIKQLIDQLLTKEIAYFLGIGLSAENAVENIEAVIGQSNIFFVLDNSVLYPTWMVVASIIKQLQTVEGALAKMHVTLSSNFNKPSKKQLLAEKEEAKKENPWKPGDPYGEGILDVGRYYGNMIMQSASIDRVNLAININEILQSVYDTALKDM